MSSKHPGQQPGRVGRELARALIAGNHVAQYEMFRTIGDGNRFRFARIPCTLTGLRPRMGLSGTATVFARPFDTPGRCDELLSPSPPPRLLGFPASLANA